MTVKEFLHGLPRRVVPEALEGKDSLFHFLISGDEGGEFTVRIRDGEVRVSDGLEGTPKCTVRAKDKHFMKVVNGEMNATMAVMTGKVKISNLSEMMEYAKLLGF